MGQWCTEIGVPRIEVGIEVNDGDGSMLFVQGLENRVRNGVVAAESYDLGAVSGQFIHTRFDLANRLRDIEGINPEITGVDNLCERKRHRVLCGVVRAQQAR